MAPNSSLLVYSYYSQFRQRFSQLEFWDVMHYVWAYGNNLQYDMPLPSGLEAPPKFKQSDDRWIRGMNSVFEWELEFFLSEAISQLTPGKESPYTISEFQNQALLINSIRKLRDITENERVSKDNIFLEFNRIAHS
jgi:hypothetical protein